MKILIIITLAAIVCSSENLNRVKRQGWKRKDGGLPPGLAKRTSQGGLPPGLAKRTGQGGALPPGLQKQADNGDLPPGLKKKLPEVEQDYSESPSFLPEKFGEPGGPPINNTEALELLAQVIRTSDIRSGISGKTLFIFVPDARPYHKFESCYTTRNEVGHCRFLQYCVLPEFLYDYNEFLNSICLIQRRMVGVCCPDRHFSKYNEYNYVYPNTPSNIKIELQPPVTVPSIPRPTPDQFSKDCGINYKTKIVGGTVSDPKDWRWMAALLKGNSHFCGGALISENYVITAAHCLVGYKEDDVKVRLGEFDFGRDDDGLPQDFDISNIIRHTQFDPFTFKNDIALLKLGRSSTFTEYALPICLPNPNIDFTGLIAIVAGWGTLSFGGRDSNVLRQVSLPIWNNTECDKFYSQSISRHYLCAGSRHKKEDACQGDSGGPLMIERRDNRWMIVGIVSWGAKCADPNFPGVYTRITEYLEWIRFHMT